MYTQPSSAWQPENRKPLLPADSLAVLLAVGLAFGSTIAVADYRSDIGYTKLQQDLGASIPKGTSVIVSQVEASMPVNLWMPDILDAEFAGKTIVNASNASPGLYSTHATGVGHDFYGLSTSIAPAIVNISAFEVNDWLTTGFLQTVNGPGGFRPNISTNRIANHSWVGTTGAPYAPGTADNYILRRADWLVETDEFMQVVALGNNPEGGPPPSNMALLATAYNVISVGRSDGLHMQGSMALDTTYTAGRTRPEIVDPINSTSSATPHVSAAAVLLVEAGHANPGLSTDPVSVSMTNRAGVLVRNAERSEVIKAALMAGADRVTHNSAPNPTNLARYRGTVTDQATNGLDRRYGAGQLNVRNSYWIIAGGEQNSTEDGNAGANVASRGFDYDPSFGGSSSSNTTATYPLPIQTYPRLLTASLVWNLDIVGGSNPNSFSPTAYFRDLNIALIDLANGNAAVASSASTLENTENLWVVIPANAQYAVRVTRTGSFNWDYGLAWQLLQDTDADGAYDAQDNCINVANGPLVTDAGGNSQLDADGDGYGNICDADLNNSGLVTVADYNILRNVLNTADPVADLDGSGQVTVVDYTILRNRLNTAPGPSGLAP